MYQVNFPLQNRTVAVEAGTTVLAAEIAAGLRPNAPCGGMGVCGKCSVEILGPDGSRETVLACETKIDRDLTVFAESEEEHRILIEGVGELSRIAPAVKTVSLKVEKATLQSPTSDWERLRQAIFAAAETEIRPDPTMADGLGKTLEALDYRPQAVLYRDELLSLRKEGRLLTVAVDIGTTTVVLYLADGITGEVLSTGSMLNPQTEFGADVSSRANYAMEHTPRALSSVIRSAVGELLSSALSEANASEQDVFSIVIVGNTCMHHLFLGIDPSSLVLSPYVPSISEPLVLNAADYDIPINARGKLFLLPCIAGFVGADTASVMIACEFDRRDKLTLAIDIGTNGELVLGNRERTAACSTAAGPAFEGAKITFGMRGAAGAIDHAAIENGVLRYSVIGGGKPRGICGSGLLDLTATMLSAGVLDETGRISDPEDLPKQNRELENRIRTIGDLRCFVIAEASESETGECVYLSQKDIREVQLAKGAMAAGISLLLEYLGKQEDEIQKVLIAGAFGNYMSPESACAIGLIPAKLLSKIEMVGNAAGRGALMCALNETYYLRSAKMAAKTEFIELASNPNFQDRFVDELMFPEEEE